MRSAPRLVRAESVRHACELLRDSGPAVRVLNGGTELVRQLREGEIECDSLLDIKRVPELAAITASDGASLAIGATLKHWDIARSTLVRKSAPALARACSELGNIRVRAQGTLGGNLAYGHPQTDPGTVLLAHGARIRLTSCVGSRWLDVRDLWLADQSTALRPDELLCTIDVDRVPADSHWGYRRIEVFHRPPSVIVALQLILDGGAVDRARIAVGAVSSIPRRLNTLEARLRGLPVAAAADEVARKRRQIANELEPRGDDAFSSTDKVDIVCGVLSDLLRRAATTVQGELH